MTQADHDPPCPDCGEEEPHQECKPELVDARRRFRDRLDEIAREHPEHLGDPEQARRTERWLEEQGEDGQG